MGKPIGPEKVHRYSNTFKVQAVRLSLHPEIQRSTWPPRSISSHSCCRVGKRAGGKDDSKPG
jgi:hypothetical protein